ncbi:MAG: exodeoxyribonuclease VII small subunit [Actinomycetota bacterium]
MSSKKTPAGEPKGYAEAMSELEGILRELDSASVDVDVLSVKVQRASFLVEWCTSRITAAQATIDELVAGLPEDDGDYDDADEDDDGEDDYGDDDEDYDEDDDE